MKKEDKRILDIEQVLALLKFAYTAGVAGESYLNVLDELGQVLRKELGKREY